MSKEIKKTEQDGVCPCCGGQLAFVGNHEIQDDSTRVNWECPRCGADGVQWHDIVFAYHKDLCRADGWPLAEEVELNGIDLGCGEICPMCHGELEFLGDQTIMDGTTEVSWRCESCGTTGTEVSVTRFSEHLDFAPAIRRKAYERYQLAWMIQHGFSLRELFSSLGELEQEVDDKLPAKTLFEIWESDRGFGGELYVCFEEFVNCEYSDKDKMQKLLNSEEYKTYLADRETHFD